MTEVIRPHNSIAAPTPDFSLQAAPAPAIDFFPKRPKTCGSSSTGLVLRMQFINNLEVCPGQVDVEVVERHEGL